MCVFVCVCDNVCTCVRTYVLLSMLLAKIKCYGGHVNSCITLLVTQGNSDIPNMLNEMGRDGVIT